MTALTWTRERPTEPGFYWARVRKVLSEEWEPAETTVVYERGGSLWVETMNGTGPIDRYATCEWAGPLVPPS